MTTRIRPMADLDKAAREAAEEYRSAVEALGNNRHPSPAQTRNIERLEAHAIETREQLSAVIEANEKDARFHEAYAASGFVHPDEERSARVTDKRADEFLRHAKRDDTFEVRTFGENIEERAALFVSSTEARGSATVPTSIAGVVESRINVAGLIDRGLTVIRTNSGEDLYVPRRASLSAFDRVVEGGTIGQSDPTLGGVTLKAYKAAAIAKASHEFLMDSAIDVVGFVGRQFGDSADLYLEEAVMTGAVGGDSFTGSIAGGTVGKTLASASAVTADELLDLAYSLGQRYRRNAVMVLAPSVVLAARKLKASGTGDYVWRDMAEGGGSIAGIPVIESPFTAELDGTNDAVVGAVLDPSAVAVRLAGGLRIDRSDEFAFSTDEVAWRAAFRADVSIIDPEGVRTLKAAAA